MTTTAGPAHLPAFLWRASNKWPVTNFFNCTGSSNAIVTANGTMPGASAAQLAPKRAMSFSVVTSVSPSRAAWAANRRISSPENA